jgi:putative ABC transport system permease protein
LVEAAVVGLGGGIAGLGLAHVVSWVLGWAFNAYAASQGVDGPMAVFVFPWWLLLGAVVYAILISIVSGLYPASRAANVDPIQALRGN